MPKVNAAEESTKTIKDSKCRSLSTKDEHALKGFNLQSIHDMKSLHALGVAMGGPISYP